MAKQFQKLELNWIGKGNEPKLEPRILMENPEYSFGDPSAENILINGDNLLALKALEQNFTERIKCIYIDPPFNTGSAFEHYDDGVEHSIWLNLMKIRFDILKNLLSDDGFFLLHLDNSEMFYAKVLCDEIFRRDNFVNCITMTTNDPSGFKATSSSLFSTVNYILIYAKNKNASKIKKIFLEKGYDSGYSKVLINRELPFSEWEWENINDAVVRENGFKSLKEAKNTLGDEFEEKIAEYAIKNAPRVFQLVAIGGGAKIKRNKTIELSKNNPGKVYIHPDEDVPDFYILNGRQIVFYDKRLILIDGMLLPGQLLTDVWTDISWNGISNEGDVDFKNGKKPEKLIQRCLELTSNEGDIVLDSFLGSGTTAAVAHKMKRKWIGIELGNHAKTHCYPRLKSVVQGEQTGISRAVNWRGGGGFKFYQLATSLLNQDKYGNWVISKEYNPSMLAAAMAKQEGFYYQPDASIYWKQGKSSEKDYIYTTTQFITVEMLDKIYDEMKPDESLLISCKSYQKECENKFGNISIKKIPQMLLGKCEFGKEDYSLNIVNLPKDDTENDADIEQVEKPKKTKKAIDNSMNLFD